MKRLISTWQKPIKLRHSFPFLNKYNDESKFMRKMKKKLNL